MSQSKLTLSVALAAGLIGTLATIGPVEAADLDPALEDAPQVMPSLPLSGVVFGSGWYVRGDIGATRLPHVNPINPPKLNTQSIGNFQSDAPNIDLTPSHEIGYSASLGAGYAFNRWFRGDLTINMVQPVHSQTYGHPFACQNGYGPVQSTTTTNGTTTTTTTGTTNPKPTYETCNGIFQANLKSYAALANAYFDFGTWYNVTPYVGAGAGLSWGQYTTSSNYFQADGTSYDINVTNPATASTYHLYFDRAAQHTYYNPAYALMAGFAIGIYDHTLLDINYRYLNLGNILGHNLYTNEVRAGLRYMIDN